MSAIGDKQLRKHLLQEQVQKRKREGVTASAAASSTNADERQPTLPVEELEDWISSDDDPATVTE